jgi:CRP/FNR family cyclic AMP-dependent transcriptional regulator
VARDDLDRLLRAAGRRRRYARREVLFHEGDPADSLHLIDKGRVVVRVATTIGASVTLDVLGPGDLVGELAILEPPGPRGGTAMALEPTDTVVVAASVVQQLRRDHPGLTDALLELLTRRNRQLMGRLAEMASVPADTRVLRRLQEIASSAPHEPDGSVVVHLTQDDLAGLAGTTRETVNRVLHKEVAAGTVSLGRGRITVLNQRSVSS